MIKLMPAIFENYDCVQAIIANVLNHYKTPWKLMFMGVIGFEYSKFDGGGFTLHTGGTDEETLDKIYGIHEIPLAAQNIFDLKNSINNKDLLCLYVDGFYCPWHQAFNKHHIAHYKVYPLSRTFRVFVFQLNIFISYGTDFQFNRCHLL